MVDKRPIVLVLGATGNTGRSIVGGLLKSGQYSVAALTRPSSASKPEVDVLRSQGVEIRIGDYTSDPPEKLAEYVDNVFALVSAVSAKGTEPQKAILKVAVDKGVKRIIPSDFGTPGAKGVRALNDVKLEIRDLMKGWCAASNSVSTYTFVDIGWWMEYLLPSSSKVASPLGPYGDEYYTQDGKPFIMTDVTTVGAYIARILGDPRAANRYVIVWQDELPLRNAREIAEVASGEAEAIRKRRYVLDKDALLKRVEESKAQYLATMDADALPRAIWNISEYMISIHYLGECTLENAKKLGALDVRELYPDIVPRSFKHFAKGHYNAGSAA